MENSVYEPLIKTLTDQLSIALREIFNITSPYREDGGLEGQLFALLDFDTFRDDPEFPLLSGPSALRHAIVAEGTVLFTTFVPDHQTAVSRFLELALRIRQGIPRMRTYAINPILLYQIDLADGGQLTRVVSQALKAGQGSLWTMHITGQIKARMIINRDPRSGLHSLPIDL